MKYTLILIILSIAYCSCSSFNKKAYYDSVLLYDENLNRVIFSCGNDTIVINEKFDFLQSYPTPKNLIQCYSDTNFKGDESIADELFDFLNSIPKENATGLFYYTGKSLKFRGSNIFSRLLAYSNEHNCISNQEETGYPSGVTHYNAVSKALYGMIQSIDDMPVEVYIKTNFDLASITSIDNKNQCYDEFSEAFFNIINSANQNGRIQLKSYNEE